MKGGGQRWKGSMQRLFSTYRVLIVAAGIMLAALWMLPHLLVANAIGVSDPRSGDVQQNTQRYRGNAFFGDHGFHVGQNQANTGNEGANHGFNQDNTANAGNQVSGQRKAIKTQINNQYYRPGSGAGGGSGSGNTATFIGAFQGNSGNSGINLGNNQDNSGNFGNEVNNQGNIIGTQVNKQGSTVVNDGNIIQHQINYVQLIPGIGVYLSIRPRLQFSISVGN